MAMNLSGYQLPISCTVSAMQIIFVASLNSLVQCTSMCHQQNGAQLLMRKISQFPRALLLSSWFTHLSATLITQFIFIKTRTHFFKLHTVPVFFSTWISFTKYVHLCKTVYKCWKQQEHQLLLKIRHVLSSLLYREKPS